MPATWTGLAPLCLLTLPASLLSQPIESIPFQLTEDSPSETLFSRIPASDSGLVIENPYDDPLMWTKRYREFMGGGMGSGIATGDFDNDGLPDIFVSTKTKQGRLYRNLGNWKFSDVTEDAGLGEKSSLFGWLGGDDSIIWRQGATFADINNDGWLDLYVCRNNAPNLLYLNRGNGTFEEKAESLGLAIVDGSVVGAFADYDRDGWLDLLLLTNQVDGSEPYGRPDRLFRNRGNGSFVETTQSSGIQSASFGHAATWIDYDNDNWPDLYICNDFSGPDYLYRNNHDGTFTNTLNEAVPHTPYSSMGADVGDINNDGFLDLLVADMATTNREKDRRGLAASRSDMLTTGTTEGVAPQYNRNALYLNSGLGRFLEAAAWAGLEATDWTWSVRFEDFDNDGWEDLHVTNGMVREANNSDLLARMMRALSDLQRIAVMKRSPTLEETNLAYQNLKGEGFAPVTKKWGLTDIGVTFGAATADFDRDGDLDLAYLDYNGGLAVYRNNSASTNRIQISLNGTTSNRFGVGAVLRLKSKSTGTQTRSILVSRGYASGSEPLAHFGLGPDQTATSLHITWPSGIEQTFENLSANQIYLITEPNSKPTHKKPTADTLFADQSEVFGLNLTDESELAIPDSEQAFLPFRTDRAGPSVAIADVDSNGQDDLFLAATTGSPQRLFLATEKGFTESKSRISIANTVEDGPSLLFDANGDSYPDLLVTKASASAKHWPSAFQPKLFLNDGSGAFSPSSLLPPIQINASSAIAADIDADGDLDLFLGARSVPARYPETPHSILLRNDNGSFTEITADTPSLSEIGLVKSALFRDVDTDGLPDIILALEWDYVRYFHNEGNGKFSDQTETSGFASGGRGWWNGLAAADINGDGKIDFAAGNLGLNTTYEASPDAPATLLYGDFAQNGTSLLAEAVYDKGERFPLRSRVDIATRLPFVLRKYPKNDDFARATFTDVYGERATEQALTFEADNFQSGAFLSQTDGSYQFFPFPSLAQIGSTQGLLAMDLDGDGLVDIAATQNSDIGIPRFHGGLGYFLKGSADGSFLFVHPTVSGITIPENGRALVAIDPNDDARPDLFFTQQGGQSGLFVNDTSSDITWIKIQLRPSKNTPHTVGARIEIKFTDGASRHFQTGAGGGWLSQSSQDIFVALPQNASVSQAIVHWPNGSTTSHQNPPSRGTWKLQATPTP